jgi:hypothetical protein
MTNLCTHIDDPRSGDDVIGWWRSIDQVQQAGTFQTGA